MTVRRERRAGQVVIPAEYAREHVELGYATTAFRAQGRTVDTAHTVISESTTREVLYVAATRGRLSNILYVDTATTVDIDTSHGPEPERNAAQVLTTVLDNVGSDIAAHTMIEREQSRTNSPRQLLAEYQTLATLARDLGPDDEITRALHQRATLSELHRANGHHSQLETEHSMEPIGPDGPTPR
jgi:hypothetical protein